MDDDDRELRLRLLYTRAIIVELALGMKFYNESGDRLTSVESVLNCMLKEKQVRLETPRMERN